MSKQMKAEKGAAKVGDSRPSQEKAQIVPFADEQKHVEAFLFGDSASQAEAGREGRDEKDELFELVQDERVARAAIVEIMKRLILVGIGPNLHTITEITNRDELPILVFEVHDLWMETLVKLGWEGKPVFAMPKHEAARLFRNVDAVTAPWIMRAAPLGGFHLLVYMHAASLLLNFDPRKGLSLEPGSTDRESQS
jgi:hypothetical protein